MSDDKSKEQLNEDDGDEIVCRCEEVTRSEVEELIEEGVTTIKGIKNRTRSGMGPCQGRVCSHNIRQILIAKGVDPEEIDQPRSRPPVRPVKIKDFSDK